MNHFPWAAAVAAAVLGVGAARADAPCDKGFRDTTAGERGHMTRILEAVKKTLPPAPAGWVIVGDDQLSVPQSLCMDYERKPWQYDFSRSYQRVDNQAARDQAIAAAAALFQADQQRKQPRLDAIMKKMEALTQQQVALMQKGDMNRAAALNDQMAALQAEYKTIIDEGDAQERGEAMMNAVERDTSMHVTVAINPWVTSPRPEGAQDLALPAGAKLAFRWSNAGQVIPSDGAQVFYGLYRPTSSGHLGLVARGTVPSNLVHAISVRVTADPGRLAGTLAAIDFNSLGRLVPP